VRLAESKPAKALTGLAAAGLGAGLVSAESLATEPAKAPLDRSIGHSDCEPWRDIIVMKLDAGLSAQRIYQDLTRETGCALSYHSVRRFVRKLRGRSELPFRRMECDPGEEAQVDFGTAAPIVASDGKRRRPHVFRVVLSHSRKAYSEVSLRQTTEDFIRCLENAFWHFGGVPKTLVIDNLRAAVKHPDWFDPELVPKLQAFCRHYGTVILPTKPYTPRHKGKVERGVGYVKGNALKGRTFRSAEEQNQFLWDWEATIADTRIHGTTKRQVSKVFAEVEQAALLPLPVERFPFFHEAERSVNRDGHVEVAKAYYSTPPEYRARKVWVRWDARVVRIFNHRLEQLAMHVRQQPGRFSTRPNHIAREKVSGVERGTAWLLGKVKPIGSQSLAWAEAMLKHRGIEGVRVLQGLLRLAGDHPADAVEKACEIALAAGVFQLRPVRKLLARHGAKQQPLEFLEEHPIIRPLADYRDWLGAALSRDRGSPNGFGRHDGANDPSFWNWCCRTKCWCAANGSSGGGSKRPCFESSRHSTISIGRSIPQSRRSKSLIWRPAGSSARTVTCCFWDRRAWESRSWSRPSAIRPSSWGMWSCIARSSMWSETSCTTRRSPETIKCWPSTSNRTWSSSTTWG
jgi:transposase